ncbi:carbohydrate kinase family protein [Patescibacteria group bacterium]|nr:carbohydrate kinase family protein [Patescibacteria group bacterium]MBU1501098.1 carbohydrate kinase family protein [Patescibacteria group bacterium]MBU2081029.1 carbohydrate kinase family protein [Patescibacteria group bacterium]MBU2124120.1 carbohydrate kinase family protein [Patescibacteria group bacterium]MBU2194976.1 carbohydrate kinase family protein [Patescibacteria group bacterium]
MSHIEFLAIGDIVTEPFIRLTDAHVAPGVNPESKEICMRFGDKIPYEYAVHAVAVGNASNAAVAASRLGLPASLRSYVGDDRYGTECIEVLQKEGVDTSLMVTEAGKITNYHFVLWYGSERTILVKHEEFAYTVPELSESPKWIYLSSLAENSLPYHEALVALLEAHPETKLVFQPGTFQMKIGKEALAPLYARSELFFSNKEEAQRILELPEEHDIKVLLEEIHALGPKIVVITDGREGAYAYDGARKLHVPMYPDTRPPFERTGAGDAFSATVAVALALGYPLDQALLWGPINSMSVVQEVGAQKGLLTREALDAYLKDAPPEYTLTELN